MVETIKKTKKAITDTVDSTNKVLDKYYMPTPVKLRKIGDTLQDLSFIAAGIVALFATPPVWIPVAIMATGRLGKIITNFFTYDR